MGHIELASPVSHVWFFKAFPAASASSWTSRSGTSSASSTRSLQDAGGPQGAEILTEERYRELYDQQPDRFTAAMGAEAIKDLLARVDVDTLARELRDRMRTETSQQKRIKFAKRSRCRTLSASRGTGRSDDPRRHPRHPA